MRRNDNLNVEKLHNQLGYSNKMDMIELKKMMKEFCTRFVEKIKAFDPEFYPSIKVLFITCSNMETFVMSTATENAKL